MEENKKKKFRLFNSQREGKGVSREDANLPPNLKRFWRSYRRDFSRLLSVNILYVLGNFPLLFIVTALSGVFMLSYPTPASDVFPIVDSVTSLVGANGLTLTLGGAFGTIVEGSIFSLTDYIFFGIGALTLFTFGFVNVGTTYIIRNMIIGDPVFVWSDFWYAIKRNKKQGFIFGILDVAILGTLGFNIVTQYSGLYMAENPFFHSVIFWANVVIAVFYLVMRFYLYLQIVTFDLSVFKILKNALLFTLIGIKRNLLAILGCLLLIALNLFFLFGMGIFISVGVIMPLVLLFSNCSYFCAYAAYFKIKQIMIDPYYEEHPEEDPSLPPDEEDSILSQPLPDNS